MKRFALLSMVMLLIAGLLTGCAQPESEVAAPDAPTDEVVTLRIYAQYSDDDSKVPFDYAVEQLAIDFPNVMLELDIQAQDDGMKLQTYAATGNLPDIFQVGLAQIETFKESGNIMVLNDVAKRTGFLDRIYPTAKNIVYNEDGNIYAFPYAGNELVLWYYNKALFDKYAVKVPETFDELLTAIKVFNENDIIPMSIFAKEKWITTAMYDVLATRFDPAGIAKLDAGEGKASDEAFTKAAEALNQLVKAGMFAEGATNTNYDQAAALFHEGKAAMFLNGQWEIAASTEKLGENVDWMWYPTMPGYEANRFALSGGGAPGGFAVSPHSEHKELAAEVAAYLAEKYAEARFKFRGSPINAVQVDPSIQPVTPFPAMMKKLAEEMKNITSTTKFAWGLSNPLFKVAIEDQSQFLMTPEYTPAEFIAELDKVISRMTQ